MVTHFLYDDFSSLTGFLTDSRVLYLMAFWGVVTAIAVAAYVKAVPGPHSVRSLVRYCLPAGILTHPSASADFLFWISRKLVYPIFVVPLALSPVIVGYGLHAMIAPWIGAAAPSGAEPSTVVLLLFTATMLVVSDLAYYFYHRAQHRFPILWELHKVHHSAEVMVGTTKDRIHPIDDVMNGLWNALVSGAVYAIWLFFYDGLTEITIIGINVYTARNLLILDFIRHTHLPLSYGRWIDAILISPHYHQLHHSVDPRHYDRNFGLAFAFWDRMFGTLMPPETGEAFRFGLGDTESREYRSVLRLYYVPLRNIGRMLRGWSRTPHAGDVEWQ
jgi:sterol desaturase/sphingolipid hydroxylase (fatty acid hydroxylase superfamily)